MKRIQIVACSALAVALMGSCSKDQVTQENPGNAIRFKSIAGSATKVAETTTGDVTDFKVYAFTGTNPTFTPFYTDVYTNNGSGSTYVSDNGITHYWPADQSLNCVFTGYSPADLSNSFVTAPTDNVTDPSQVATRTISGIQPKQNAADQVDLLVFRGWGTAANNATDGVTLYMKHAMSQIQVKAVNSDATMTVKVKGVKVVAKNKANLALPDNGTSQSAAFTISHWALTDDADYTSYLSMGAETPMSTDASAPTDLMYTNGGFMLIPQTLASWSGGADADGAYIAVLCQISQGGTQLYPTTQGGFGYAAVAIPAGTTWQPGMKYVYTLKFFDNGGGGGTQPPVDPTDPTEPVDPGTPGDPVLGNPIKLTVDVTTWADGLNLGTTPGAGDVPME